MFTTAGDVYHAFQVCIPDFFLRRKKCVEMVTEGFKAPLTFVLTLPVPALFHGCYVWRGLGDGRGRTIDNLDTYNIKSTWTSIGNSQPPRI